MPSFHSCTGLSWHYATSNQFEKSWWWFKCSWPYFICIFSNYSLIISSLLKRLVLTYQANHFSLESLDSGTVDLSLWNKIYYYKFLMVAIAIFDSNNMYIPFCPCKSCSSLPQAQNTNYHNLCWLMCNFNYGILLYRVYYFACLFFGNCSVNRNYNYNSNNNNSNNNNNNNNNNRWILCNLMSVCSFSANLTLLCVRGGTGISSFRVVSQDYSQKWNC